MPTQHRLTNSGTALVSTAIDDASLPAGSIYFSGSANGQYITIPPNPAFTLGTSNFTIECWWYGSGAQNTYSVIYAYANNATNQAANSLYFSPSQGSASVALGNGAGGWVMSPNFSWSQNTWYHHAFVRNGNTFTTYHNGVAVQTATYSGTITAQGNNSFEIGGQISGSGNLGGTAFLGYVSNFRVVVGTAVYTAAFTPPQSQLTAISGTQLLLNSVNSSTLIQDFSTNNWPVYNSTSVTASTNNPFTPSGGNYMVSFDGSTQYLSITNSSAFNFGTGDFTMEAWVNLATGTSSRLITSRATAAAASGTWSFTLGTTIMSFTEVVVGEPGVSATFSSIANVWSHVAVSRSSGTTRLFLNGVLQASGSQTTSFSNISYPVYICTSPTETYIQGYVSNLKVVKGQALYTSAFTPSAVPLTATSQGALFSSVSLLTCQSPVIIDNSPNNFTITNNGSAIVMAGTAFTTNNTMGSAYFTSSAYFTTPGNSALTVNTQNFTVEGWAYWTGTAGTTAVWYGHFYQQFSGDYGIQLGINSTGYPYAYLQNGNGGGQQITLASTTLAQRCTWIYYALSRIGANASLFINGIRVATSAAAGITLGHNAVAIGRYSTNTAGLPWPGYVSNVRLIVGTGLYNPTLTSMTVPSGPLTLTSQGANPTQVQLLTCQNPAVINDNSINNWTLTPSSGTFVTAQTNGPFLQNSTTVKQRLINDGTLAVNSQMDDLSLSAGSISFNGTSQYVTAPSGPAFQYGTGAFTIEFWIYPTAFSSYRSIQGNNSSAASSTGFHIGLNASGNIFIYSASAFKVTSSNTMTVNAWNHVAVVRSGSTVSIYINGAVSTNTWTLTSETFTDGNCFLGAYYFSGTPGEYTAGYISNLRIVKGTAVYTAAFSPPRSALLPITNTQLLINGTNSAGLLQDNGPNNFPIRSYPGVSVLDNNSPFSQSGLNYMVSLNGSNQSLSVSAGTGFSGASFNAEMWIYLTAYAPSYSGAYNSCMLGTGDGSNGFEFLVSGTASSYTGFSFLARAGGGTAVSYAPTYAFVLNTWYHVALVQLGTTLTIYVNGTSVGSTTTASWTDNATLYIGYLPASGYNYWFPGYISNVRILKGQAIYTSNFTPSTTPLTRTSQGAIAANVNLLTCQNSLARDNSTNNYAITNNGTATFIPSSLFATEMVPQFGYSNYFLTASSNMLYYQFPSTIPTVTGDFTVEAWVYPTGTEASYIFLFGAQKQAYGADEAIILAKSSGTINIAGGSGSATGYTANYPGSATVSTGQWSHIALVRANGTLTAYLNGVGGTGVSASGSIAPYLQRSDLSGPLGYYIGTTYANWTAFSPIYYSGYISNLRYVTGQALYTANFTPSTVPLTTTSQGAQASNVVLLLCQRGAASPTTNAVPGGITFTNNQVTVAAQSNGPFLQSSAVLKQRLLNDGTLEVYDQFDEVSLNSGAISFNGSTQYLTLASPLATAIRTSSFTWETWIYVTTLAGVISVYDTSSSGDTTATGRFLIYIATDGTLRLYTGTTTILMNSSAGAITVNTWYHIAVSRSGTTGYMFVNGAQVNTATVSTDFLVTTTATNNRPIIGANGYDLSQKLTGYISNLRLVIGTAVYTASFTPNRAMLTPIQGTQLLLNCANTATLLLDSSPNQFPITPGPAAYPIAVSSPFVGATTNNYAVSLNGSSQVLAVTTTASTLAFGTGNFTLECWIFQTAAPSAQYICDARTAAVWAAGWGLVNNGGLQWYNGSGASVEYALSLNITGSWHHVAFVRNSTTMTLYYDGLAVSSGTDSTNYTASAGTLTIGDRYSSGAGNKFSGYISNFRVNKGQALYTASFTPITSPLTTSSQGSQAANVSLLTCQSLAIVDNSASALAITNTGTVTTFLSQGTSAVPVYGIKFSGTSQWLTSPNNSVFDFGSGDFTIESWVFITSSSTAEQIIWGKRASSAVYAPIIFGLKLVTSTYQTYVIGSAGSSWIINGGFTTGTIGVPTNIWAHLACVRLGSTIKTYVNGVQDLNITGVSATLMTNSDVQTIGASATDGTSPVYGYLSNLRAVKGLAVYTGAFTVSSFPNVFLTATQPANPFGGANTMPITGNATSILTCQSSTIVDNSSNQLAITNNGASTFYSTGPFV